MNIIGLTGADMRAMADVAEQLLELTTGAGVGVAIMLYIENAEQVRALRHNSHGITEIWRIGPDHGRLDLNPTLDAYLESRLGQASLREQVARQFARFTESPSLFHHQGRAVQAAELTQE